MKALLFLIDDSSIGFWKREEEATWSSYLRNCGMTTVEITSITRDMGSTARVVADRLWEARKEEPGSIGLLVTDQQLFGGQFDGSDLAAKLIKEKVVERAVVFSEIACLRPEQLALPLIAESRIRTRAAIAKELSIEKGSSALSRGTR